jgi:hypothetical protein
MVPLNIVYLVSSGRTKGGGGATSISWIADEFCRVQSMGFNKSQNWPPYPHTHYSGN